jgi:hypothetical protein
MKMLNRFALIARPADPYVEWAAKVFGQSEASVREELAENEPSVYLLPESDAPDINDPDLLKGYWRSIFKEELESWCTDENTWPKHKTEALFRAWFKLQLCTVVNDLGKEALVAEG